MAHMLETKEQRAAERAMEMRARKAAAAAAAAEAAKSFGGCAVHKAKRGGAGLC